MKQNDLRRILILTLTFLGAWVGFRVVLPFFLPFLLGGILAALVQPQVRFLHRTLRLPRGVSSALAVTAGLLLLGLCVVLLGSAGYREAAILARGLPGAVQQFSGRAMELQTWVLARVRMAPAGLVKPLEQMILDLFNGGSILVEKATGVVLHLAGSVVGGISGGALLTGTAVISSYMISAQYPQLHRKAVESRLWTRRGKPVWDRLREALGGWLRAQLKLSGVTFCLVLGGFWLLRVEQAVLWALLTAVVDAVPMLGTGTVLIPMAVISLIWGDRVRGIGLIGLYVTALVTRSSLEPRLVGRHLGLNPLATLAALYAGFRLWGIWGMLLAPVLAVLAVQLAGE